MGKKYDSGERGGNIPKRKDLPKKDEPKGNDELQKKFDQKVKDYDNLQKKFDEEKKKSTTNATDLAKALAEKADLLKKLSASEASEKKLRADLDAIKKAAEELQKKLEAAEKAVKEAKAAPPVFSKVDLSDLSPEQRENVQKALDEILNAKEIIENNKKKSDERRAILDRLLG